MQYSLPKGTKDIYSDEMLLWHYAEEKIREITRDFGFSEIRTPIFEHTELFLRGVGETTDIVQKEMYTFEDKAQRSITLRPEGTAGAVRAYIQNGMASLPQPVKLYYIESMFRYEKMQAGRQRQFNQFGIELFGAESALADAEVIALAYEFLHRVGINKIELRINSLGCPSCRAEYNKALTDYIGSNLESLCPDCKERFLKNPLRVLDCKEEGCKRILANAPSILEHLDNECAEHFEKLKALLNAMNIPFVIDSRIVRGLDYYTRTVFEFVTTQIGSQGTVCGGGRYDRLVEECGGKPTPACGFGLGIERLLLLLKAQEAIKLEKAPADIYIGAMGEKGSLLAASLCFLLRGHGVYAECDIIGRSVKAQMKYADKLSARFSVILGDNEVETNKAELKNMQNGEKTPVKLEYLCDTVIDLLKLK